ncbi:MULTISPECIES: hypothetical protein [unclassified Bradyrhizobium]|uniref:hypothetical protein n=1 Tax=unclassified Bradyrhizobium TaxID=2631580 RepID=UPI001FFBC2D8|nr:MULTISPECIES: hypothetical protein [unclassified Bradyrhizobium]MCK1536840.1 hypothetical protein [Bradyrhizobium sp. 176]MCK1560143.1 hypothetical protein [Bradyrhizobium sp. 171]
MNDRCENCRFYRLIEYRGECHAAPPVRLPRKFEDGATAGNRVRDEKLIWGWPSVKPGDWCGQWFRQPTSTQAGDESSSQKLKEARAQ